MELKFIKFHLVEAAFRTSDVLIFILSNIKHSSFMKAIFKSRWVFSITFAASATLILGAGYVPALIIFLYNLSTNNAVFLFDPEVIFTIFVSVCFLSFGLILSGE